MLEDLGHQEVAAGSADEALAHLRGDQPFALVGADYAMPGMTGLELCAQVRAHCPSTRVLMMSGYAELPSGVETAVARVSKPFNQASLAAGIGRAMEAALEPGSLEPAGSA